MTWSDRVPMSIIGYELEAGCHVAKALALLHRTYVAPLVVRA